MSNELTGEQARIMELREAIHDIAHHHHEGYQACPVCERALELAKASGEPIDHLIVLTITEASLLKSAAQFGLAVLEHRGKSLDTLERAVDKVRQQFNRATGR